MARKQNKKEAFYFPHDANARRDDKILELRAKYGWKGYGLFWAIIEVLREATNYAYSMSSLAGLALELNTDKDELHEFLGCCIDLGLFTENEGFFYSESLMFRMEQIDETRRKRAEAGRKGGFAKAKSKQNSSNAKANSGNKRKERRRNEIKENEKSDTSQFTSINNEEFPFDNFWNLYPKKVGRKPASDKWKKLSPADKKAIMQFVPKYLKIQEPKFYLNPTTLISQRRWEDDLDSLKIIKNEKIDLNRRKQTKGNKSSKELEIERMQERYSNNG